MKRMLALLAFVLALCAAQINPARAGEKMCIFGMGGQSNAEGLGERPGPAVPNTVWTYQATSPYWSMSNEVAGNGSMRPNFGAEFFNLTGIRVLFVKNTVNGGFQTDAANSVSSGTPDKSWDINGTATPTMIAQLNAAMTWATSAGFDAKHCGMLWSQGEAEANGIVWNPTVVTKAIYKVALIAMIGRFRDEFGPDYPFYIFKTGALSNAILALPANAGLDTGYAQVRAAQEEVAALSQYNLIASRMALAGQARGQLIPDGIHWSQDLNDAMGLDGARRVVASGLWNRW